MMIDQTRLARRAVLAGLALALPATATLAQGPAISGDWTGPLDVGARVLRMRLVVADGSAALYSLDQNAAAAIPAEVVSLTADRIELRFPLIKAALVGRLTPDGQIDALFDQGAPVPILLAPAGRTPVAPPLTQGMLEGWRSAANLPALAALGSRRGGRTLQWQAGERAMGSGIAVQPNDLWHLGSNTKSMTATLAAVLVEKGLIRWDDTVGKVLGAAAPQMRDAYRDVTYRHLFSHRSGMQANIPMAELYKFPQVSADSRADRLAFAAMALAMEPRGPKEATYEYSNNGYITAGAMMEAATGQPWEMLIRTHLFQPLKITTAGFGAPADGDPKRQPVRHIGRAPNAPNAIPDNPAPLGPAGRAHMSLPDLSLYLAAHRDRAPLLKPESWALLHAAPFGGDYAYGWIVSPDGTRWHNGTNGQWYAGMQFNAASGISSAAVCNDALGQTVISALMTRAGAAVA